ncbi:unnamed protein product [Rhizoctonia solani]|uniref:Xylanolytic transcriptional activator regulatory domain-containing protein n=1 Tax=Rhizoctonia solani TaxID=456999 RepID=A0A8H3E829_9AGAM|nr:unnamed protein product [Rhizoctonia solani]
MEVAAETLEKPPEILPRNAMADSPDAEDVKYPIKSANTNTPYIPAAPGYSRQDKIKDIEDKIRAVEQRRESSSSVACRTPGKSTPPGSSFVIRQPFCSSPMSNDGSEFSSTPSPPFMQDLVALRVLDSDLSSYPASGFPWIEAAMSRRLASEGLDVHPNSLRSMLTIFMFRRGLTGYKLHTGRVLYNLSTSTKPILALLYSILLTACHFTQDMELKSWETALLERTKSEIEANIALAHEYGSERYNSLYHLQAMLILSQYYFFKSRMLEGHVYTNSTIQFAIAMGIHRLDTRMIDRYATTIGSNSRSKWGYWQPRDSIELGEAINLLWGCVARDLIGGVMNGLAPSLPPEEITTVWPFPLAAFVENSNLPGDHYSVKELLDPDSRTLVADVSRDNAACLLIKALVLVYYAGNFDTERVSKPELTNEWWARFEDCDGAIQKFIETIPPFDAGRSPEEVSHIVLAHTTIDCATLQLHGALAECELGTGTHGGSHPSDGLPGGRSYARCSAACRNIVLVTAHLEGIDLSFMHMFIGVTWICAGSVLAKQIRWLRESGHSEQLQTAEQDMLVLERSMERYLKTYPVFNPWVEQLRAMRNW